MTPDGAWRLPMRQIVGTFRNLLAAGCHQSAPSGAF
jgi:hypothetical protein